MVHALQEAQRVLKPDGILIDLRPAPEHRRLGLGEDRHWKLVGELHEQLDDDHAADAAVAEVVRAGIFRRGRRITVQLDRVMDTVSDVREWLADFDQRRGLPSHREILNRLEKQLARLDRPTKIAIRGPLILAVLRKPDMVQKRRRPGGHMILAILPDTSKTESLLNNLSEADFDLKEVSVVMKDVALRNKIAKDTGPLRGAQPEMLPEALKKAGISDEAAKRCTDAVSNGKVLVAMNVDAKYLKAASEMFTDHSGEIIQG